MLSRGKLLHVTQCETFAIESRNLIQLFATRLPSTNVLTKIQRQAKTETWGKTSSVTHDFDLCLSRASTEIMSNHRLDQLWYSILIDAYLRFAMRYSAKKLIYCFDPRNSCSLKVGENTVLGWYHLLRENSNRCSNL